MIEIVWRELFKKLINSINFAIITFSFAYWTERCSINPNYSRSAVLTAEAAVGSFVLQAAASDNDTDTRNSNITYSIDSGDAGDSGAGTQVEKLFRINSTTGELQLVSPLPDGQLDIRFGIVATDDGAPPFQTRVEAIVFIQRSGSLFHLLLFALLRNLLFQKC